MDFKSLISKIDSIESPNQPKEATEAPRKIQLDEDMAIRVLAGTKTINEASELMERKQSTEEKSEASEQNISELDMNLIKAAQKGQEGKPIGKPDSESDKNVRKKYGYRMDGEPAERDDDETKQERRGRKRQNKGESIAMERQVDGDEFGDEGPEDLLYAVEREIKNPGKSIDNLIDVQNATFGSDDSPEFEKARRIIEKYIEFVDNADVDHPSDDPDDEEPMIRAMTHGNIARHIREYDLTDYLVAASDMLEKIIAKGKSEGFNRRAFESKFAKMVEAKKTEAMKKTVKGKKADEKMDEGKKSKPDFLDVDKDGDKKEPMKKAAKEADKGEDKKETKGLSAKQKKLPPGLQKAIAKKKGKTESVRASKKVVSESVELKLSFRDMMKLVIESGGQQQIDPLDQTLFAWATRVAQSKFQESAKAEVYAGLVYERMGGRFEMYDVLSESKKKINEEADSRVAKLAKLTIQVMEKDGAKVGPNSDFHTIFDVLEQDYQGEKILRLVKQLDNEDFNTWETMIHDHFMPYEEIDEDWKKKLAAAAMAGVMGLGAIGGASAADMTDKDSAADRPVATKSEYSSMIEVEGKVRDLAKVDKQAAKSYEATKNLYNKLLGKAKSSDDMKQIDKEYTKSLQTIIDLSLNATPGGG